MASKRQNGAVSIFSVIFAALLLTVLTVGFIGLMISGQQRAINNDLSQSAYDSALAGVEDAKRVVRACLGGNAQACEALETSENCSVISQSEIVGSATDEETVIRSSSSNSGEQFDQAYTCVNIDMNTPDYRDEVREGSSRIVPLRATGDFNQVVIEWYTQDDAGEAVLAAKEPIPGDIEGLPQRDAWDAAAPPLVRAQMITPGEDYNLASLDSSDASRTVFLRPSTVSGGPGGLAVLISNLPRATNENEVTNKTTPVPCSSNFANNGHSCRVILELAPGDIVSQSDSNNALLRLNTIYKTANVRVSLMLDGNPVMFYGVQPLVDSTGRANDLFRRVEARLMVGDDFPYPSYGVDVTNALCKNFAVSDSEAISTACSP